MIGSGPAGLAAAAQLNSLGHAVTVYERSEAIGGLMRLGVPDFKLEKWVIDRRVEVLREEGIDFHTGTEIGSDVTVEDVLDGARRARPHDRGPAGTPLDVPGAELGGVHFAMEYLAGRNRLIARAEGRDAGEPPEDPITATGKRVAVIGGGDTAADCVASALREQAVEVVQLDRYPRPDGSQTGS